MSTLLQRLRGKGHRTLATHFGRREAVARYERESGAEVLPVTIACSRLRDRAERLTGPGGPRPRHEPFIGRAS
jgi:hypothetical protein